MPKGVYQRSENTKERLRTIGLGKKNIKITGEKNPKWKGNDADYQSKHDWMRRQFGRPSRCENCGASKAPNGYHKPSFFQWANMSGKYLRERKDWKRLCRFCHVKYDTLMRRKAKKKL